MKKINKIFKLKKIHKIKFNIEGKERLKFAKIKFCLKKNIKKNIVFFRKIFLKNISNDKKSYN